MIPLRLAASCPLGIETQLLVLLADDRGASIERDQIKTVDTGP